MLLVKSLKNVIFGKSELFPDFQYGCRSSHSIKNLVSKIVSGRIARTFNRSDVTRVAILHISKAFDSVQYVIVLHKHKSYGISDQDFSLLHFSVTDDFGWFLVGVYQSFIIVFTLFLICINDVFDDIVIL